MITEEFTRIKMKELDQIKIGNRLGYSLQKSKEI
jgi:hypothetical protein